MWLCVVSWGSLRLLPLPLPTKLGRALVVGAYRSRWAEMSLGMLSRGSLLEGLATRQQ
jgi:hypothetical protein